MKRLLLTVVTVLIGAAVVGGAVWYASLGGDLPPTLSAKPAGTMKTPNGTKPHATLELSIFPNSSSTQPGPEIDNPLAQDLSNNQGWPFYSPSTNLELPANSVVTVTLHQFDTGGQIYNPWLAKVTGTVDGTATYDGEKKDGIDPNNVAHTFTIHQYPESTQPYFFVSVPMPAQSQNAKNLPNGYPKPIDVTFTFETGAPGEYVWNCEFPCGNGYVEFGGPMSQRGWMSGTVKVV